MTSAILSPFRNNTLCVEQELWMRKRFEYKIVKFTTGAGGALGSLWVVRRAGEEAKSGGGLPNKTPNGP